MLRKTLALILCLGLLLGAVCAEDAAAEEQRVDVAQSGYDALGIPAEPRYRGKLAYTCKVYTEPDENAEVVGRIIKGEYFWIYAVYPSWTYISYGTTRGFIRRSCIDHANVIDQSTTPPYGVDFYAYSAAVSEEAPVKSGPDADSDTLITLYEGARVALLGFENGWAN